MSSCIDGAVFFLGSGLALVNCGRARIETVAMAENVMIFAIFFMMRQAVSSLSDT